jgi:O-antigen ligase
VSPRLIPRLLLIGFGVALVTLFAVFNWSSPFGLFAIACVPLLLGILFGRDLWHWALPISCFALLVPTASGFRTYDAIASVVVVAGVLAILLRRNRRDWKLTLGDVLAVATLVVPLLGLAAVVSPLSFAGVFKDFLVFAGLYLVLTRVVPAERRDVLLWSFPVLGSAIGLQLMNRVAGVGSLLLQRTWFRNFYTDLGWGQSNYIAAVLLVCIFGTLLLMARNRSWLAFVVSALAILIMLQSFSVTLSRGATASLAIGFLVTILLWGWRLRLAGLVLAFFGAGALTVTQSGQVLLSRFVDPLEYASWLTRLQYWELAWNRFLQRPWTGIGLNQGRYMGDRLGSENPHNIVLTYLMEQGLLGGLLIVTIIVTIWVACWRLRSSSRGGAERATRAISLGLVTATFLHAMVEPTIPSYIITVPFVFFLVWLSLPRASERAAAQALPEAPVLTTKTASAAA